MRNKNTLYAVAAVILGICSGLQFMSGNMVLGAATAVASLANVVYFFVKPNKSI